METEKCNELLCCRHESCIFGTPNNHNGEKEKPTTKNSFENWLLKWKIKNKIRHYQRELNKIK